MKVILWDFDGVIIDSMSIRDMGFRKIFKKFDVKLVDKLLEYHNLNGGLSRYHKIRYFFEKIIKKDTNTEEVSKYAEQFSIIMRSELIKKKYIINNTFNFIKDFHLKYHFHIVSGSDEKELQYLCSMLDLSSFFITINGSPVEKKTLVKNIIYKYKYNLKDICLIGDSVNDLDAANDNKISFFGYNNVNLINNNNYIRSFNAFKF